jgi:hypothetical protein
MFVLARRTVRLLSVLAVAPLLSACAVGVTYLKEPDPVEVAAFSGKVRRIVVNPYIDACDYGSAKGESYFVMLARGKTDLRPYYSKKSLAAATAVLKEKGYEVEVDWGRPHENLVDPFAGTGGGGPGFPRAKRPLANSEDTAYIDMYVATEGGSYEREYTSEERVYTLRDSTGREVGSVNTPVTRSYTVSRYEVQARVSVFTAGKTEPMVALWGESVSGNSYDYETAIRRALRDIPNRSSSSPAATGAK